MKLYKLTSNTNSTAYKLSIITKIIIILINSLNNNGYLNV